MATIDLDARLEMHVFGATQGESIVLKLPSGGWGVIDCYASALDDPVQNATYQFLAERGATELEFLCLTHPHEDHFRGMGQLLEHFPVRCFWRPPALHGQRLSWLLKLSQLDGMRSGDKQTIQNANELERVFTLVRDARRRGSTPLIPKNAAVGMQVYPVPTNLNATFQIWSLAPTGEQTDRYEEGLRRCFDDSGRLRERLPHARHNDISLALLVVFGETRLVLGGDVETAGWAGSTEEFGREQLDCLAVKVSHHGSVTGYQDGLWRAFANSHKPIAVLTPFRRHGLPEREALEHIGEFAERILTPCLSATLATKPRVPLSALAPVKSRKALQKEFKATSDSASFPAGRCSLIFNGRGECVEQVVEPPAGMIPRVRSQ